MQLLCGYNNHVNIICDCRKSLSAQKKISETQGNSCVNKYTIDYTYAGCFSLKNKMFIYHMRCCVQMKRHNRLSVDCQNKAQHRKECRQLFYITLTGVLITAVRPTTVRAFKAAHKEMTVKSLT